jgi:hypothetical protein
MIARCARPQHDLHQCKTAGQAAAARSHLALIKTGAI